MELQLEALLWVFFPESFFAGEDLGSSFFFFGRRLFLGSFGFLFLFFFLFGLFRFNDDFQSQFSRLLGFGLFLLSLRGGCYGLRGGFGFFGLFLG